MISAPSSLLRVKSVYYYYHHQGLDSAASLSEVLDCGIVRGCLHAFSVTILLSSPLNSPEAMATSLNLLYVHLIVLPQVMLYDPACSPARRMSSKRKFSATKPLDFLCWCSSPCTSLLVSAASRKRLKLNGPGVYHFRLVGRHNRLGVANRLGLVVRRPPHCTMRRADPSFRKWLDLTGCESKQSRAKTKQ